jgi:nitrous oxidase accessory protein
MENRAPQYGMRVLVIEVSPLGVSGDAKEIDTLGHYVGIRSVESFALLERALAPYAIGLTALAAFALPLLRPSRWRTLLAAAVIAVPVGFAADLWAWQHHAVSDIDPHAPLNLIANRVQARLIGAYSVAQFKVEAHFAAGFWHAVVAAMNALGFIVAEGRRRAKPALAPAPASVAPARAAAAGAALVAIACAFAAPASAATLEVGAGAPFATIGAALRAAAPGDEVLVRPGTYAEHVVIDRAITLRASSPAAVLDAGGRGSAVTIVGVPAAVCGFTIRASGESLLDEDAGVKLERASGSVVEGNRIEDALFGILVRGGERLRIARNHVTGKDLPIPRRADGIRLQDASGSLVEENLVEGARDLAIWSSNGCTTRGNTVRRCRYGLHYMYCDDNVFEGNVFEENQTGGAIMYSRRLTLRRNRFAGSRGPSAHGLLVKSADDVLAEENWFVDNTRGLFFDQTTTSRRARCTVRRNVIGGNETGVCLEPSASRIVFSENAFIANRVQVEALGWAKAEQNEWSEGGRGNYWSDYVGFDADRDGIGDSEYRVDRFFESLAERWPAVGLLRFSPAVEALESAARAFPVAQPKPVLVDAHPLMRPPAALGAAPASEPRPSLVVGGGAAACAAALVLLKLRGGAS